MAAKDLIQSLIIKAILDSSNQRIDPNYLAVIQQMGRSTPPQAAAAELLSADPMKQAASIGNKVSPQELRQLISSPAQSGGLSREELEAYDAPLSRRGPGVVEDSPPPNPMTMPFEDLKSLLGAAYQKRERDFRAVDALDPQNPRTLIQLEAAKDRAALAERSYNALEKAYDNRWKDENARSSRGSSEAARISAGAAASRASTAAGQLDLNERQFGYTQERGERDWALELAKFENTLTNQEGIRKRGERGNLLRQSSDEARIVGDFNEEARKAAEAFAGGNRELGEAIIRAYMQQDRDFLTHMGDMIPPEAEHVPGWEPDSPRSVLYRKLGIPYSPRKVGPSTAIPLPQMRDPGAMGQLIAMLLASQSPGSPTSPNYVGSPQPTLPYELYRSLVDQED